jgi:hypothetical protein
MHDALVITGSDGGFYIIIIIIIIELTMTQAW